MSEHPTNRFSLVSMIALMVPALIFIRVLIFEPFEIKGPSMEPTLLNGDRIVVSKYPYGLTMDFFGISIGAAGALWSWGMPAAGDIVIVKSPMDEENIVKRVIGVPGDTIEVKAGKVFRNGQKLLYRRVGACDDNAQLNRDPSCIVFGEKIVFAEKIVSDRENASDQISRYRISLDPEWCEYESGSRCEAAKFKVPKGHVYVRGDHRDHSNDSSNPMVGLIPRSRIRGRAEFVYISCAKERAILCKPSEMRTERMGMGL